jgi:pimeloyl-ACP methyl ester carboxylesterase
MTLHAVVEGEGPLVVLLHGFPEGWWAWRRQLPALAAAGFRAAAVDLRGYGGSPKPEAVEAYRMLAHVADTVEVVRALGAERAVVVGHDWGSPIAAACALMRPDVFTAVGLLGVPYTPRSDLRPAFPPDFYVGHFQAPGVAEAEIEADVRGWLRGFYSALDGGSPAVPWFQVPMRLPTDAPLPAWLAEAELETVAAGFARDGMRGPLNRYRNFDRDWEDLAAFDGVTIEQPAIFIAGAEDSSIAWLADAVAQQAAWLPGLTGVHLLEGCGHWVQQERPQRVNELLVEWLVSAGRR